MTLIHPQKRAPRPLVAPSRQHTPGPADEPAQPVEPPERIRPKGATAGRGIATVLLALVMAALLCADSLVQVAERQAFGTARDVALAVARPIRSVSHATGLHLPRLWLAELTGNDELPTSSASQDIDVPTAAAPTTKPRRKPAKRQNPAVTATTAAPTTTTTLPPRRTPTAADPLRVVLFGDSLMGHLAVGFGRLVQDEPRVSVYSEYHISTGLARPDVLDWPAYLAEVLPAYDPEVVYLTFGGNDDQAMQTADGTVVALGTPEWQAEYTRRVGLTMDVAAQGDRTVVWIGLPAQGRDRLNGAKDVMNAVAIEQAALRPRVVYVDLGAVLTPDGQFHEYLSAPDGTPVRVREGDGVHVSIPGGEFAAPTLLAAITTDWNLVAPAPTTPAPGPTPPP